MITINQKWAFRSAGRESKSEERKYKLKCIERITGHNITVQSVLTIYFWFDWNMYGLSTLLCLNELVSCVIWSQRVKLLSKNPDSIKTSPIITTEPSQLLSSFRHIKFASLYKRWCPTVSARHSPLLYLSLNKTSSVIDFSVA